MKTKKLSNNDKLHVQKTSLGEVLSKLAKKELQVKLLVGYRDCLNGYGWRTRYYVEIIECKEYCSKCRVNFDVDYKEDYYPLRHQHSHRQEYKTIFSNEFMCEKQMINELLNYT